MAVQSLIESLSVFYKEESVEQLGWEAAQESGCQAGGLESNLITHIEKARCGACL